MKRFLLGSALGAYVLTGSAAAADLPVTRPLKASRLQAVYDWTGFYLGGHAGYGAGSLGPGSNALPLQGTFFPPSVTGLIGGYQAGYNMQLPHHLVVGAETDISFASNIDRPRVAPAPFNSSIDAIGTIRGRIGYAFGTLLPYVTGGVALASTHVNINDPNGNPLSQMSHTHAGWVAGAGVEVAMGGKWSGKVEYDYIDLAAQRFGLADIALPDLRVDPRVHTIKFGLNYRLWETPPWAPAGEPAINRRTLAESTDWNVHAQTTVIAQGYPTYRSPYEGANSLPGAGQVRETWTAGAFLGWRLWQGGEFYFGPELAQGFGIGSTLGIAGFSNGEAQKGGSEFPRFRAQRYFFRQTFGLGGEQEDVADAANQLPGKRDIDRVTLTVGRFAIGDYFDGNSYAKDPRIDFLNWAIWASAAYDFPADLPGFTRGAVVELNRRDWAVRAGLFQVPAQPNSDVLTFNTGGAVVEFEERHQISGQPGKLRLGAFVNRGNTGSYRGALATEAADPALDINEVMASLRRQALKYGFYVNGEQQITTDVGIFARVSWNDGQNEILSFTDIDRSVSAGVSIKGSHWGRASDTIGIGGAINGLSDGHRDFLAAGGYGLLIGDSRLNYRRERILESYYAYALNRQMTLTADYQLIVNPAYNADRGPVSVFSGRLHGEF